MEGGFQADPKTLISPTGKVLSACPESAAMGPVTAQTGQDCVERGKLKLGNPTTASRNPLHTWVLADFNALPSSAFLPAFSSNVDFLSTVACICTQPASTAFGLTPVICIRSPQLLHLRDRGTRSGPPHGYWRCCHPSPPPASRPTRRDSASSPSHVTVPCRHPKPHPNPLPIHIPATANDTKKAIRYRHHLTWGCTIARFGAGEPRLPKQRLTPRYPYSSCLAA